MLSRRSARLKNEPPLNKTLRRVLAGATSTRASGVARKTPINLNKDPQGKQFSRVEIVSEKLCDDLIKYLGPTLKPYKGCTILDVHPGACLWSKKLHEFLKPKCHILMEPDDLYTQEFIKPLLDKQGSKYRHFKEPFLNPATNGYVHPYARALEFARETGMRDVPNLSISTRDYDDPRIRLINSKLLMTGNLARVYLKRSPNGILYRELMAALDNTSLHRNGLVRQLWWMPDRPRFKTSVVPQVITGRTSGTAMIALAADVTEVVGVNLTTKDGNATEDSSQNYFRSRSTTLGAENTREVQARMRNAGMRVPNRRKLLQHPGRHKLEFSPRSPFTVIHKTVDEVDQAITDFGKYIDDLRAISKDWTRSSLKKSAWEPLLNNLEYPQCMSAAVENAIHMSINYGDPPTRLLQLKAIYLDTMLRMINLETHVVVLRDQNHDISSFQSRLRTYDLEISEKLMKHLAESSTAMLEDQLLHFSRPQNFLYDRRKFDPLLAHPSDFWPPSGLALYDCVPLSRDLDVEDIAPRDEVLKVARDLSKLLFPLKNFRLPEALDRIAPNAAQDLIPKVKELTDPRRGGRLDARNVVVRMIGDDMFEGLIRAWFEWPFKPDRWDLEIEGAAGTRQPGGGGSPYSVEKE